MKSNQRIIIIVLSVIAAAAVVLAAYAIKTKVFPPYSPATTPSASDNSESDELTSLQKARLDAQAKSDINAIYAQLEGYYADYGFYPSEINPTTLPEANPDIFEPPSDKYEYIFEPSPEACGGTQSSPCTSYTLKTTLLKDGSVYSQDSLSI